MGSHFYAGSTDLLQPSAYSTVTTLLRKLYESASELLQNFFRTAETLMQNCNRPEKQLLQRCCLPVAAKFNYDRTLLRQVNRVATDLLKNCYLSRQAYTICIVVMFRSYDYIVLWSRGKCSMIANLQNTKTVHQARYFVVLPIALVAVQTYVYLSFAS